MKIKPDNFESTGKFIMSNFDMNIDNEVVELIKNKPLWANYAGYNFCGDVWFEDKQWHCEIWQYGCYKQTFSADTLEKIMHDVIDEYGAN